MKFVFTPQRRDESLHISVSGETVTMNGIDFDFSVIPEGATLPSDAISSEFFFGDVSRISGELEVGVLLPHGANPAKEIAFPEPVIISDGVVVDTGNGVYPWVVTNEQH